MRSLNAQRINTATANIVINVVCAVRLLKDNAARIKYMIGKQNLTASAAFLVVSLGQVMFFNIRFFKVHCVTQCQPEDDKINIHLE